jgi:hypothetical protein
MSYLSASSRDLPRLDLPRFSFHYKPSSGNIKRLLEAISEDFLSRNYLHNWDEDLVSDPVRQLVVFARNALASSKLVDASYMVNFNFVREVCTIKGENHHRPSHQNSSGVRSQFFPGWVNQVDHAHMPS